MNSIFQGREITSGFGGGERSDGLVAVDPSRFQVLHVEARCSIKEFVLENSLIFKTGRGFYEFTKPEIISHKKEVVLVDRATGDMFTGHEAAEMIGGISRVILLPELNLKRALYSRRSREGEACCAGFVASFCSEHELQQGPCSPHWFPL